MSDNQNTAIGPRIRNMNDLEIEEFIMRVSRESGEAGARNALERIGLGDENAGEDIRAVRGILGGYRIMKRKAVTTTVAGIGKMLGWAVILALASLILHFAPESTRRIAERMIEP